MKTYRVILLITAGLLFTATLRVLHLPDSFLTFLRIIVCGVAAYAAFRFRGEIVPFLALLMAVALFNPVLFVDLPEKVWRIIYLATAAAFIRIAIKSVETQNH